MGLGSGKVAVVTVHGTNDGADSVDGEKWWQRGSSFCDCLLSDLRVLGVDAEIVPFRWSGANNVLERERAASDLTRAIERIRKGFSGVHVIGHSHGGNVANDAAILMRWGRRGRRDYIDSLITVGTPYLKNPVSAFQRAGALAFLIIAVFGAVVLAGVSLASFNNYFVNGGSPLNEVVVLVIFLGLGAVFYRMISEARQGVRRVSRPGLDPRSRVSILSIWHPADEAISILRAAGALEIEPFPRGAIFLGSRTGAILWAVRIVIVFVLAAEGFLVAHFLGAGDAIEAGLSSIGLGAVGQWLNDPLRFGLRADDLATYLIAAASVLGVAALLWLAVYVVFRAIFGALIEVLGRSYANRAIRDVFRGMAFGSVGDQRPAEVDVCSYAFRSVRAKLDGELAERLKSAAEESANSLLNKYRWELFSVGANHADLFDRIPKDAMTWKSLIHTTYFDQPEIAAMIANHIASPGSNGS